MQKSSGLLSSSLRHKRLRALLLVPALAALMAGCGQDPMVAGKEHMTKGDYAAAVIEFKNAVQAKPDSVEARLALADAFEHSFDPANTEQHLRKALESGGDADQLVPRIATLMLERGQLEPLIREFKDRHLKTPEAESTLRALVAIAYVSQKRSPLAEEQLKTAPNSTPAVKLARAQLLLAGGQADLALTELNASPSDTAASWWTLRALSRVYNAVGNPAKALETIKKAHDAAPWHRGLIGEYAEALIAAGKIEEAIPLRDKLKKLAPNYFWTHYLNAVILAREGRSEDSHAAALRVLAASPDHLPAVLLASSAELQKGDVLMADSRLRKILKQYPYSVPALQMQATTQLQLGKPKEAADTIRHGLTVAPSDVRLLSLKVDTELKSGETSKAVTTLESLIATHPKDAPSLLRLSELKARQGNKQGAAALLDRATEAGQDDPMVRDRIISIAMRTGDTARVRQLADHALQSRPQDPQSHLVQAVALGYQNDTAGAWRATLAALDLKPGFDAALMALANMAKEPAQRQELRARYEKAVESKTSTAQTYLAYATLLKADESSKTGVVPLLEKGVAAQPASSVLREALVQEHMRAGNADTALSVAQSGAAVNNAPATATALLANTYERLGKSELATETYRKLVSGYPQRADWRLKLAELEIAANRNAQATTLLRGLMTERPFDSTAYIALARLTVRDNPREALSIAGELGKLEPHKLTAMLLEGDVLAESGKPDEALKQYSKAAKAGADPAASLRIVGLLDRTNRGASADDEMASSLRKFPEDAGVLGYAAQRALTQGKAGKAVELRQKIIAKNPRNAVVLNDLAWAQIQARQPQALDNALKAAQLMPNNPNVLDTLGMAQALAGKRDESIVSLRTAVNLAPTAALPRLHLAEQLLAAGQGKVAASVLAAVDSKQLGKTDQATLAQLNKSLQN
ncbi:XrtA/PEP-CTERM system TPR-repeat protein PrsT [Rhodoferax sp.]|uniref:XrtA/PEP-CTERM system TPR-repeat protein PrsT n=1 Tax=Rhodoferax sp. TaxID=50421 RepID=UPI002727FFAA|nr:XrtA/PEP-CTERM system TPR-repeat protein PrsT [Rhodoferax sp.]MDO9197240.1 PEP-CTERM system TPR-repeat protein PrsT [Rhodoferax sp.]